MKAPKSHPIILNNNEESKESHSPIPKSLQNNENSKRAKSAVPQIHSSSKQNLQNEPNPKIGINKEMLNQEYEPE
jgi:hypothetical protein